MKFSAVIFDMDGTMLDTERTYREVFNRAAADCEVDFPESLHFELLGRNSTRHRADPDRALERRRALLRRASSTAAAITTRNASTAQPLEMKPGLLDLLDFLEQRNVPKIVATSTRRSNAIPRLTRANLLHRFATRHDRRPGRARQTRPGPVSPRRLHDQRPAGRVHRAGRQRSRRRRRPCRRHDRLHDPGHEATLRSHPRPRARRSARRWSK